MGKLTRFEHLRECAEKAKNYATGAIAALAEKVFEALTEIEEVKADKPQAVPVTIAVNGWSADGNADYPHYYDIAVAGITDKDRAEITIAPDGMDTAIACGLCPTNETLAGKIRVRSVSVPTSEITAEYWIVNGRE